LLLSQTFTTGILVRYQHQATITSTTDCLPKEIPTTRLNKPYSKRLSVFVTINERVSHSQVPHQTTNGFTEDCIQQPEPIPSDGHWLLLPSLLTLPP
jgi:hypothetical protein